MSSHEADFCRVCRCEGTTTQPLFHPCLCIGSIKYVHQECLIRWLHYSKRQTCELCRHQFQFQPVYAANTPVTMPLDVLIAGLILKFKHFFFKCLHFCVVLFSWLFVVPLTVCRIYKCLFSGNIAGLLSLPLEVLSTDNLVSDCIQGFLIVIITLIAFLGYVWFRDQLTAIGEPPWLAANAPRQTQDARNEGIPDEFANPTHAVDIEPDTDPEPEVTVNAHTESSSIAVPDNQTAPASDAANHQAIEPAALVDEVQEENNVVAPAAVDPNGAGIGDDFEPIGPMNWERIFGLDGTMNFLEHALWLIALNIFFIFIFAFYPLYTGQYILSFFGLDTKVLTTSIENILHTFIGYLTIGFSLMFLHLFFKYLQLFRLSVFFGMFYVYIKVSIIAFIELGLFTAFCGLWIDACSLVMFNASVSQRLRAFNFAPLVFTFIHWTMGLMYLLYVSMIFVLIRTVLRPGLIWFIQDFNDPDYRPILEMINLPILSYTQKLVVNFSLTGIAVILSLWLPSLIVQHAVPGFLPLQLSLTYDSPVDYSVEIILIQVMLPFLLDEQVKAGLRSLLRWWCICVAWLLNIRSYLLGDVAFHPGDIIVMADGSLVQFGVTSDITKKNENDHVNANNLSTADEVPVHTTFTAEHNNADDPPEEENAEDEEHRFPEDNANGELNYAPYIRPSYFPLRVTGLVVVIVVSITTTSVFLLTIPLRLGRSMSTQFGWSPSSHHDTLTILFGFAGVVTFLKIVIQIPNAIMACRNNFQLIYNLLTGLGTWNRWEWISEYGAALGHWLRGGSLHPLLNRQIQDSTVPTIRDQQPRRTLNALFTELCRHSIHVVYAIWHAISVVLLGLVMLFLLPASLGLLINLVFLIPFRVDTQKSLVIGFSEHWIFGVMHLKVWLLMLLIGPRWKLRDWLEEVHDEIVQHWPIINALQIIYKLMPLLVVTGTSISLPFIVAHHLGSFINIPLELSFRYVYPLFFIIALTILGAHVAVRQFFKLKEQIKDDKYLIGRQLVNYCTTDQAQFAGRQQFALLG